MSVILDRVRYKIDPWWVAIIYFLYKLFYGYQKADDFKRKLNNRLLKSQFLKPNSWDFNKVVLPLLPEDLITQLYGVYLDTLFVHCKFQDNYSEKMFSQLDKVLPEGPYSYINENFRVHVESGDYVIDAGAWIGDFSALASYYGAKVYAFEPSSHNFKYLEETSKLNPNIITVPMGLGSGKETMFVEQGKFGSVSNNLVKEAVSEEKIEITSLDDFVRINDIRKIDFIKSDIEGAEREMLKGATYVLRNFAPKLAICTYHLPDDPEVIKDIILNANPSYTIIQKRMKLYAAVIKDE